MVLMGKCHFYLKLNVTAQHSILNKLVWQKLSVCPFE